jgi:two-component system sensor histidine kinase UhpB
MWQRLSLRARLNTLLALVLVMGLGINVVRLVLEAAPRVAAEDQSVIRLAREFIQTLVAGLNDTPDPEARLVEIIVDLNRLRHVSISRDGAAQAGVAPQRSPLPATEPSAREAGAPAWFVRLVHPEQTTVRVPVQVRGQSLGALVVASHPDDEIAEIWDGIVTQIEVGSAIAMLLLLITMTVVGRALAPIGELAAAMARIGAGGYDTRVRPSGPPELADIGARLNRLAAALGEAVEDKRQLAARIVSLQDAERKEIASELHDEFGPYLFALRAHGDALMRLADVAEPDMAALRRHGGAMLDQVNALQQSNRRVLERLRPAGLSELGLREALDALARTWRETKPGVAVEIAWSSELAFADEAVELTVYRVVQEALTNVFRHAGATRVTVTIAVGEAVSVRVVDNGAGLAADHRLGLGLTGMRERVLALGGTVEVTSTEQGVIVKADVPLGDRT